MNLDDLIKAELQGLVDSLEDDVGPVAKESIRRIGIYLQRAVENGDWERAQRNIAFERSILASQASIAASEVKIRIRNVFQQAIGMAIETALAAL